MNLSEANTLKKGDLVLCVRDNAKRINYETYKLKKGEFYEVDYIGLGNNTGLYIKGCSISWSVMRFEKVPQKLTIHKNMKVWLNSK